MRQYKVDLHIHTCLSPCGSLDMNPEAIARMALSRGLDAIAITDHNTTLQYPEIRTIGERLGLVVFAGVEVTTREEAHCLVFLETDEARVEFQRYLDLHLPPIPNDPSYFGDQVWVNADNEIQGEVPYLLLSALDQSVNQIAAKAKELEGLFVAAHVERPSFSLISQLGFIDPDLSLDAVEYATYQRYKALLAQHPYLELYSFYSASDAHSIGQIGEKFALLQSDTLSFSDLRKAFAKENNHSIYSVHE